MVSYFRKTLHDAGAAATAAGAVASVGEDWGVCSFVVSVVGSTGIASGVITVEAAHAADYAGTWASLGTISPVASTVVMSAFETAARHIRARISTIIGGGTVTVVVDVARKS